MMVRHPHYSKEEFARRGDDIYNRQIRPQLTDTQQGKFVAIDIETGAWEIDFDALTACERLITRYRDSQTWLVRVGYPYLHRIGGPRRVLKPQ